MADTNRKATPRQLAHVGFGAARFEEMKGWWRGALGAEIVHENEDMALLSYDSDLTRVAIVRNDEAVPPGGGPARHVAFEFSCLADLLGRYESLREAGSEPYWSIRHRVTT